ncbi:MAG: SOS response-associated peptidase [Thermomicrobiales bacterium]|nr:SOS response-associated peptidase [Thermomicrobiales bacterium]
MCGRYVINAPEDLSERFQIRQLTLNLSHSWNVAPTTEQPVIVENRDGEREARLMTWGLTRRWARASARKGPAPINARSEGIGDKPMFRDLIRNRRCLVPANGFYEWKNLGDRKQPYYITVTDEPLFAFAGIYDAWKGENDDVVASYTIVTTQANDRMASIHERMPVIIRQEDEEEWLDRSVADAAQIERLLVPYPGEAMTITPVGRLVNNVRNDGPELIEPSTEES